MSDPLHQFSVPLHLHPLYTDMISLQKTDIQIITTNACLTNSVSVERTFWIIRSY